MSRFFIIISENLNVLMYEYNPLTFIVKLISIWTDFHHHRLCFPCNRLFRGLLFSLSLCSLPVLPLSPFPCTRLRAVMLTVIVFSELHNLVAFITTP